MLSLVRSGPESVLLHAAGKIPEIKSHLAAWGSHVALDPEQAIRLYGNNRRLVFFVSFTSPFAEEEEFETYVSENTIELLLCNLINSRLVSGVDQAKMLPGSIIMRLLGDVAKGVSAVQRDIGGELIERDPMFRSYIPGTSSVIYFTEKALNKPVATDDIYPKALLIHDRSKGALLQYLTIRGIEYLGDALGTPDWNDIEIRIYDADGFFDLHRQRFWMATQGLQIGLVLAERWGRDQALAMKSVPVYMVKIFTPMDIREIKRIALGLEYDDQGQRFADFDVFFKDRKISAYAELEAHPGLTRNAVGMIYRNDIIRNLDSDSRNEFLNIESEIRKRLQKKSD
ncbi:MAG: hypothetical protein LLF78_05855 [Synergistaceae bacterium]|nr:hypothetical protein [Synergistaceae bacterium]